MPAPGSIGAGIRYQDGVLRRVGLRQTARAKVVSKRGLAPVFSLWFSLVRGIPFNSFGLHVVAFGLTVLKEAISVYASRLLVILKLRTQHVRNAPPHPADELVEVI